MCDKIGVRFITQSSVRSVGAQYLLTKTPEFVFGMLNLFFCQDHEIPYCRVERKTQAAVFHQINFYIFDTDVVMVACYDLMMLFRKFQCKDVH